MKFDEWQPLYLKITEDFKFDRNRDYYSSIILSKILSSNPGNIERLNRFRRRNSNVIGNGPDLGKIINDLPDGVNVVADSALPVFYDHVGWPDIIVTDLDGDIELIRKCQEEGSVLVVHAHGDNIEQIKRCERSLMPDFIGTTQTYPLFNVHNFGGFTDGDRSAFLMDHLESPEITLAGFDFHTPSVKPNGNYVIKQRKLEWARNLLSLLAQRRNSEFIEGRIITI